MQSFITGLLAEMGNRVEHQAVYNPPPSPLSLSFLINNFFHHQPSPPATLSTIVLSHHQLSPIILPLHQFSVIINFLRHHPSSLLFSLGFGPLCRTTYHCLRLIHNHLSLIQCQKRQHDCRWLGSCLNLAELLNESTRPFPRP